VLTKVIKKAKQKALVQTPTGLIKMGKKVRAFKAEMLDSSRGCLIGANIPNQTKLLLDINLNQFISSYLIFSPTLNNDTPRLLYDKRYTIAPLLSYLAGRITAEIVLKFNN